MKKFTKPLKIIQKMTMKQLLRYLAALTLTDGPDESIKSKEELLEVFRREK